MARLGSLQSDADVAQMTDVPAGGGATTIADGADVAQGATTDAAATTDTGTFSLVALVKRLLGKFPALVSGRFPVDGSGVTQPVSGTVTANVGTGTQAVSAASLPLPSGAATETTLAGIKTGTDKIPTTPASEHTTAASPHAVRLTDGAAFFKPTTPSDTQPVSGTVTANDGTIATLTKGTQGATGYSTQDLKDAGRTPLLFHMTIPVVTTSTDALVSLTGFKGTAAVAATTTPAVVTAGKTLRVTAITITYVAIATAGSVKFTLRANASGVVAIGSPAVCAWVVGGPGAVAGVAFTVSIPIPDGLEFAAGTGIGLSMLGLGATQAAAAVGYGQVALVSYEY